jgi:hypothetical protein
MKMERQIKQMRINQKRMRLFGVAVAMAIDLDFMWWSLSAAEFQFLLVGSVILIFLVYLSWWIAKS